MLLRALRPPMILGASLPGMVFPAQRPAEGSNSYHYGSFTFGGQSHFVRPVFASQRPVPTSSGIRTVLRKDQKPDPEQELFRMTSCVGSDLIGFLSHNELDLVLVLCF